MCGTCAALESGIALTAACTVVGVGQVQVYFIMMI